MTNLTERQAKALELLADRKHGALSTHSKRLPGFPFGSVVNYALDAAGRPIFLFSSLAVHSKNLAEDPRASLLVFDAGVEENPLTFARVTLVGEMVAVPEEDLPEAQAAYLQKHPDSVDYLEFGDFSFHRLQVSESYFVGGFGEMGWIPGA